MHSCRRSKHKTIIFLFRQLFKFCVYFVRNWQRAYLDHRKFDHLRAPLPKLFSQRVHPFLRSGQNKTPSEKRKFFIPCQLITQRHYCTHHNDRRRVQVCSSYRLFQFFQRCADTSLSGSRSLFQNRSRSPRIHFRSKQSVHNIRKCRQAHKKHQRSLCLYIGLKGQLQRLILTFVSGDDMHGAGTMPVCHRNPVIGRHCKRTADTGYDLIVDPVCAKRQKLFSAPAKQKRITALQAHNVFSFLRLLYK